VVKYYPNLLKLLIFSKSYIGHVFYSRMYCVNNNIYHYLLYLSIIINIILYVNKDIIIDLY